MAGITDVGPTSSLPAFPTSPQGQTSAAPQPQPQPWGTDDYLKAGLSTAFAGTQLAPLARGAVKIGVGLASKVPGVIASKVPGVIAAAPRVRLGLLGLASDPLGKVIGGAGAGVVQSISDPNSPAQKDWHTDMAAQEAATSPMDKLGLAAYAPAHALWNTAKTAAQGVQLAFQDDDQAPAAAPAPAAGGVPRHPGQPYFDMAHDNFSVLLRRDGHTQLVYKHAISTVMPGAPIQLFDGVKETVGSTLTLPQRETVSARAD